MSKDDGKRAKLIHALALNGISTDLDKWRDSQGLGQAVAAVIKGK